MQRKYVEDRELLRKYIFVRRLDEIVSKERYQNTRMAFEKAEIAHIRQLYC